MLTTRGSAVTWVASYAGERIDTDSDSDSDPDPEPVN